MCYLKGLLSKKGNQKGFSLVELLIVIAIMGVLAVIAFNAFNGVLVNSKRKADDQQAKNIEKSYRILATDSGIIDIGNNATSFTTTPATSAPAANAHAKFVYVVKLLQQVATFQDSFGNSRNSGPHLNNPTTGAVAYEPCMPQWNPDAGGKYIGYTMTVTNSTNNVNVACREVSGTLSLTNGCEYIANP